MTTHMDSPKGFRTTTNRTCSKTTQNTAKLYNENLKQISLRIYQWHPSHWTETTLKHPWPWQQSLVVLDSKKPSWSLLLRSSPKGPEFSEELGTSSSHSNVICHERIPNLQVWIMEQMQQFINNYCKILQDSKRKMESELRISDLQIYLRDSRNGGFLWVSINSITGKLSCHTDVSGSSNVLPGVVRKPVSYSPKPGYISTRLLVKQPQSTLVNTMARRNRHPDRHSGSHLGTIACSIGQARHGTTLGRCVQNTQR